jgi:hypothetical protein
VKFVVIRTVRAIPAMEIRSGPLEASIPASLSGMTTAFRQARSSARRAEPLLDRNGVLALTTWPTSYLPEWPAPRPGLPTKFWFWNQRKL